MTRIAITGGTGFVGRHLAARLEEAGHHVVLVSRRTGYPISPGGTNGTTDRQATDIALTLAFAGCEAVVHCAGINREIGTQTYHAVQRSKWAAEELVRTSGLTWTIFKAGVIHGRGDHMLDHLSHAFHTFPVFGLVGLHERPVRPVAVDDVARLLEAAALGDPRLADRTIAVLGPEELGLGAAVRRVANVTGCRPLFIRLPVAAQLLIARAAEWTMRVPLISRAQVHILAEGVVEPLPFADWPPADLAPSTTFSEAVIARGLPPSGGFGLADLRCAT